MGIPTQRGNQGSPCDPLLLYVDLAILFNLNAVNCYVILHRCVLLNLHYQREGYAFANEGKPSLNQTK